MENDFLRSTKEESFARYQGYTELKGQQSGKAREGLQQPSLIEQLYSCVRSVWRHVRPKVLKRALEDS